MRRSIYNAAMAIAENPPFVLENLHTKSEEIDFDPETAQIKVRLSGGILEIDAILAKTSTAPDGTVSIEVPDHRYGNSDGHDTRQGSAILTIPNDPENPATFRFLPKQDDIYTSLPKQEENISNPALDKTLKDF